MRIRYGGPRKQLNARAATPADPTILVFSANPVIEQSEATNPGLSCRWGCLSGAGDEDPEAATGEEPVAAAATTAAVVAAAAAAAALSSAIFDVCV